MTAAMEAAAMSGRLSRLDGEFDALMADRTTRLEAYLAPYVRAHPDAFRDAVRSF